MTSEQLIYLYGIVPADAPEPPEELVGLERQPVTLLRAGGVTAVTSTVPAAEYGDQVLDQRMTDLAWLGERGLAHEQVLDWYADRGPVIPLSLFSLHAGEQRLRERLEADGERHRALLERLRGRREWGIKLWRHDQQLAEHLDELSPTLRALAADLEAAPPGRRFLLSKKRETLRTEELRSVARRVAHHTYAALQEAADAAVTIPLAANAPPGERTLLLDAAFLVAEADYPGFQRRVGELAHEFGGYGFEFEFTGPWPPYHFVERDGS